MIWLAEMVLALNLQQSTLLILQEQARRRLAQQRARVQGDPYQPTRCAYCGTLGTGRCDSCGATR